MSKRPAQASTEAIMRDCVAVQIHQLAEGIRDAVERPSERPRGVHAEDLADCASQLAMLGTAYVVADRWMRARAGATAASPEGQPSSWRRRAGALRGAIRSPRGAGAP